VGFTMDGINVDNQALGIRALNELNLLSDSYRNQIAIITFLIECLNSDVNAVNAGGGQLRSFVLKCRECGREYEPTFRYLCDECFGPLEVHYELDGLNLSKNAFSRRARSLWRYFELLPLMDEKNIFSLGAGFTSLLRAERLGRQLGIRHLYIKEDITNPTHSFKDRPANVAVAKALEFRLNAVGCASTGNLAAATSAHAAKANMPCYIFVPEDTEREKVSHALSYGAILVSVLGTYDQANWIAARFAEESNAGIVNINLRPYYVEGSKTIAFEICEQLDWSVPDNIVIPMASGALLTAVGKGFREMRELGLIDSEPRLFGAQPLGCSPIVRAFKENEERITPVGRPETVAKSLAIGEPGDGVYALRAIRRSGGAAAAASDEEILQAIHDLARFEGLFAEPGGAVSVAVLTRLIEQGYISRDETTVCLITGSGLKAPYAILDRVASPIVIKPTSDGLKRILEVVKVAAG